MTKESLILSPAYFGPLQYFFRFSDRNEVIIDQHENYNKQTYRNRCIIAAANGPLVLSIPVKRNKGSKTVVKDIRLDYDTNWQKLHYRGILSAYRSSPFFEFYFDEIEILLRKKHKFLLDLDISSTELSLKQLGLKRKIILSDSYLSVKAGLSDPRQLISPKKSLKEDPYFKTVEYNQVFRDKYGFIPNLSILDLILNAGPEALSILRKSDNRGN